jgi:hypothetical protein
LQSDDIGEVKKIRIGHDGKGLGAGWFLSRVDVDIPSLGKKHVFSCDRWLAVDEDDGAVERELFPTEAETYKAKMPVEFRIFTSDVRNAGTDANVFIAVYGDKGKTDDIKLDNKTNNFERNMTDTFKMDIEDVGKINKIRIGHDNSGIGAAWHLARVEVVDLGTKEVYHFTANRWLSKSEGDKQIVIEIPVGKVEKFVDGKIVVDESMKEDLVLYTVEVVTGKKFGCGTDANVSIVLYGDKDDSGERKLEKSLKYMNKFEKGQTDIFEINAVDLGALSKVKIWHDNSGLKPGWFLDRVSVTSAKDGQRYDFPCNRWLAKDEDDHNIVRELGLKSDIPIAGLSSAQAATIYHVYVTTSNVSGAGTDANVYIQLGFLLQI